MDQTTLLSTYGNGPDKRHNLSTLRTRSWNMPRLPAEQPCHGITPMLLGSFEVASLSALLGAPLNRPIPQQINNPIVHSTLKVWTTQFRKPFGCADFWTLSRIASNLFFLPLNMMLSSWIGIEKLSLHFRCNLEETVSFPLKNYPRNSLCPLLIYFVISRSGISCATIYQTFLTNLTTTL